MSNPMDYIENEISIIPTKTIFDDKKKVYSGKFPAISGWNKYCDELPDEDEAMSWGKIKGVSGFAIVAGEASNIACIDIDTTDEKLIKAIKEVIPYSPCIIKGDPKRGGKYLYRLYDSVHEYSPKGTLKQKVKNSKNETVVDIFYGNSYLCAPPSLHSKDLEGNEIKYEWQDFDLLTVGVENLPILDDEFILEKIDMVVRGMSKSEISSNLPVGGLDLSGVSHRADGNRYEDMVSTCAGLIAKRVDPTTAIRELLQRDELRNIGDSYFLDKTKGCNSPSREINAAKFYFGNLEQKCRNKKIDEIEVPVLGSQKVYVPNDEWGEITGRYDGDVLPQFNYKWIPCSIMRGLIQDASMATSVAPQNLFFYMLGGLSSVLGNKIKIQPYRRNTQYVETCNLYVGIVASSGERKSETTSIALRPLKSLNKTIKEEAAKENKKNVQIAKDYDVKIKKLIKDRDKEIELADDPAESEIIIELAEKIDNLQEKKPKTKNISLYEQNTTVQKLYEIAEDNQTGVYIEFNEFGSKWKDLQAKGNEAEKAFFLDGWDGRRQFLYKTKHNGENSIDELCLSVGFSAQFSIMEDIVDSLEKDKGLNDGLLQRFLIFCSDVKSSEASDISFNYPNEVNSTFENAYYVEKSDIPVCLDEDAYPLWMDFLNKTQHKKSTEKNHAIVSAISKYDGLVLRIAGNLEAIKNNGRKPKSISADTFNNAVEIIQYAEGHLRFIFSIQEKKSQDNIINMFRTAIIEDETTIRDLYKHHQKAFGKTATEAMKVIEKLVNRNIVKVVKDGRANKIKINPAIFSR